MMEQNQAKPTKKQKTYHVVYYCGVCGVRISRNHRYCHRCGTKVDWRKDDTKGE